MLDSTIAEGGGVLVGHCAGGRRPGDATILVVGEGDDLADFRRRGAETLDTEAAGGIGTAAADFEGVTSSTLNRDVAQFEALA